MAKAAPIKAESRGKVGTAAARKSRRDGRLPGIIYGHEKENLAVVLSLHDFLVLLHRGVQLLELQVDKDKRETVLIKNVQYDYLGTNPVHVDFVRVDLSERVSVSVPVVLRGTAAGVDQGGVLQQTAMELEIECLVTDIPDQLRVRVNDLNIGDTLQARDVPLPEGAALLSDPDSPVVTIAAAVEEEEEEAAAEAPAAGTAEPEVIGKGKEESEQETAQK